MAIIQGILALFLRQGGRVLNTVFGWATTLLFGKIPENRQIYVSVTAMGSVLWIVVVLGVAFPSVGTFLLSFVTLPERINPNWVRLGMLAAVVLLPLGVGAITLLLVDPEKRPKGMDKVKAIFKGYPYTLGLALTLILMCLITPFLKLQDLWRRWTTTHTPVLIDPKEYFKVVDRVEKILKKDGLTTKRERAHWLLRLPTRIFSLLGGGTAATLLANELTVLRSPQFELLLHPSDLVLRGKEADIIPVRALLTEHLVFSQAYLTWTKEANALEDRINAIFHEVIGKTTGIPSHEVMKRLGVLGADVRKVKLSYEEWEVLLRERLLLEQAFLRQTMDAEDQLQQAGLSPAASPSQADGSQERVATTGQRT